MTSLPEAPISHSEHRTNSSGTSSFDISEMFRIVSDCFEVSALTYWLDLFVSAAIGWGAFAAAYASPFGSLQYLVLLTISSLALYRVWAFTHEIAHFRTSVRHGGLRWFKTAWHLVGGIPMLSPGFLYHKVHLEHHNAHKYSKDNDAEYLPFGAGSPLNIAFYPFIVWPMPIMAIFRLTILSLISVFSKRLRNVIRENYSSAGMVPRHKRELPTGEGVRDWNVQEYTCAAVWWAILILASVGIIPFSLLVHWYFMMALMLTVNFTRALTAHRYLGQGEEMTFHEQVLDSINVTGSPWLTELWAPVGTRYHGLHHLFPTIPYHALGKAHNRLMEKLPIDHPYRQTVATGLIDALVTLWRSACAWKQEQQGRKFAPSSL